MMETTIFAQWICGENTLICYANWKDERNHNNVDIVGLSSVTQKPLWTVKVKWSDQYFDHAEELQSLLNFIESNKIEQAIVTSIEKRGKKQLEKVPINKCHILCVIRALLQVWFSL